MPPKTVLPLPPPPPFRRGEAGKRQVEGARVGISANQGLFGHGSSVIVKA